MLARLLYRDPLALGLSLTLILAMGVSALVSGGRQEDPAITNLYATIITPYPGADPAQVEALVVVPIEDAIRRVGAVAEIASVARSGIAITRIELGRRLSASQIDTAWTEVRAALADASRTLPGGAGPPDFDNRRTGAFTLIAAVVVDDLGPPISDRAILAAGRLADDLAERLRALPGTQHVAVHGRPTEEILITADADRLAGLGLDIRAVARVLAAADARSPAGRIEGADQRSGIEVAGAFGDLDRMRAAPLTLGREGGLIRVGDIATVTRTRRYPPTAEAMLDGQVAILVSARMEDDLQVDRWATAARGLLARFATDLPVGLRAVLAFDQSRYTAARFADLAIALGLGMAIVTAVLLLTLGLRAALVVAGAAPLAALLALFGLDLLGVSVHQMSMTGLIVALGLVVDCAIVAVDGVKQRLERGVDRLSAVTDTVAELRAPLFAATATTMLAFLPMALIPGPVGDFVGSIATAVIMALGASFLLATTITPALAGRLLAHPTPGRLWWRDGLSGGAAARSIRAILGAALARPRAAVLIGLALPVAGMATFPVLTPQFFPGADRDQFHVQVVLDDGAAFARTRTVVHRADAIIRALPETASVMWVIGSSAPAFYYNMTMDRDDDPAFAEALVTVRGSSARPELLDRLQRRFDAALPEAQAIVRGLAQGPPVTAPVELRFVGPDPVVLRALGDRARLAMAQTPEVVHARATGSGGGRKFSFALDEDAAHRAGLDLSSVAATLAAAVDGATGGMLVEGTEALPVRVRLAIAAHGTPEHLAALRLLPSGPSQGAAAERGEALVGASLLALGSLRVIPSGAPIHRLQGERITRVQGFVAQNVLPEQALRAVRARLDTEDAAAGALLPAGYRLEAGGDAEARAETVADIGATAGLAAAFGVAITAVVLGTLRVTGIALASAGLSAGLSALALAAFGHPFGINALMGTIGAVGVSANVAIVLLRALMDDPLARIGQREAVDRVVWAAGRHVLSTTATTFGGLLPLVLAGGGFWPPFAVAAAGGVLLSAGLSFLLVPALFLATAPQARPAPPGGAPSRHAHGITPLETAVRSGRP